MEKKYAPDFYFDSLKEYISKKISQQEFDYLSRWKKETFIFTYQKWFLPVPGYAIFEVSSKSIDKGFLINRGNMLECSTKNGSIKLEALMDSPIYPLDAICFVKDFILSLSISVSNQYFLLSDLKINFLRFYLKIDSDLQNKWHVLLSHHLFRIEICDHDGQNILEIPVNKLKSIFFDSDDIVLDFLRAPNILYFFDLINIEEVFSNLKRKSCILIFHFNQRELPEFKKDMIRFSCIPSRLVFSDFSDLIMVQKEDFSYKVCLPGLESEKSIICDISSIRGWSLNHKEVSIFPLNEDMMNISSDKDILYSCKFFPKECNFYLSFKNISSYNFPLIVRAQVSCTYKKSNEYFIEKNEFDASFRNMDGSVVYFSVNLIGDFCDFYFPDFNSFEDCKLWNWFDRLGIFKKKYEDVLEYLIFLIGIYPGKFINFSHCYKALVSIKSESIDCFIDRRGGRYLSQGIHLIATYDDSSIVFPLYSLVGSLCIKALGQVRSINTGVRLTFRFLSGRADLKWMI